MPPPSSMHDSLQRSRPHPCYLVGHRMKLYRFRYSPYARKVQMMLELAGLPHEVIEVRYGEREELARLTGGYIHVPVLVQGDGTVVTESRTICERLATRPEARHLVPAQLDAAIWAFCDFV